MMDSTKVDTLQVNKFGTRLLMGREAARNVGDKIRELLQTQETVNMIFAAAPSQNEFLAALTEEEGIDWGNIVAFHMDEYIGLPAEAPQSFGQFLRTRLFDKVPFQTVHYLNGNAEDAEAECLRYSELLEQYPVDIVCMGVGENCHIAFNDPHVADFKDPKWVKVVDLDLACRQQQVNDGCFASLDDVPRYALTLTVPALMAANYVYCMVPGPNKADAIFHTLCGGISEKYPSTILRKHPNATLFIDQDSAKLLTKGAAFSLESDLN
ncbi:glucosamine-6-phosphate deaminase [Telluribacter sp.]|jgi:glucosamine-6-phosphate deaminase|uniref:glucosamine-6-phosphate deaminase n=1 Tax=Telluribacter sp. TaxID=1978767 RepID=UPI002E115825|nr:glucosamine-6-phosphate deaminase [Telluribacter sp.]